MSAPVGVGRPFADELRALMDEQELSFRKLAQATADYRAEPFSHGYLQQLRSGERTPSPDAMETIAAAAGVKPTYFREYREHLAAQRARELEGEVGLDRVLEALEALRRRPRKR